MNSPSAFWSDLHEQLEDEGFASEYLLEWVKISTVDRLVNKLEAERADLGLSKAELGRAIHRDPAVVRRLLSSAAGNPTVESISSVAAAVGYKLELVPMDAQERETVTESLLAGAKR